MMWADQSVFYQIYPLGFCGAPAGNDGITVPRIRKVMDWIAHIGAIGADAVYFSPVFQSDAHGYDTRDYRTLDCRLGTNEDFAAVCGALHESGIRVVLDGVFNHVGRGFWAFQDVLRNRENSPYRDWFQIQFQGNNGYGDGLWYEGWEGHYELVKLNLRNEEVVSYLLDCVRFWVDTFQIDGLRLDVAYCLEPDFLRCLRAFCDSLRPDFFLVGEILGGDYHRIMGQGLLHSATNYECYKGLFSSFNSMNLFEIAHSLGRQFGPEQWTLYKGEHLLCFADNHDVARIASTLTNPAHLPLLYALLFAMPGIPCIYYGSEWGAQGKKEQGSDASLRPCFSKPEENELTQWVARCARAHRSSKALWNGSFHTVLLTNRQFVFERVCENEHILVGINADASPFTACLAVRGRAVDLLSGNAYEFHEENEMPAYRAFYWRMEE